MSDEAELLWICSYGSHAEPAAHPGALSVWDGTRVIASLPLDPAPSYGAFSADGSRLHLAAEGIPGRLITVDPAAMLTGSDAVLDDQPSGGVEACHLALSPSGRRLAVANYCDAALPTDGGVLAIFTLDHDGLPRDPRLLPLSGSGPDPVRQPGPHAHQATWLTEDLLLLCDLGTDAILTVSLETTDGTPQLLRRSPAVAGSGPRHLAVLPSGWLVVAEELVGQVSLWEPAESGYTQRARTAVLTRPDAAPPAGGSGFPSAIRLSGGGRFVHVAVRGPNVVSTLEVTPGGPEPLRLLGSVATGGDWPRDLLVDSGVLWIANQGSSTVTSCALDPVTGVAGRPRPEFDVAYPNWLSRRPSPAG